MPRSSRVLSIALLTCGLVLSGCANESKPAVTPDSASSNPVTTGATETPVPDTTTTGATSTETTPEGEVQGKSGTFTVTPPTGWTEASDQVGSVQGLETVLLAGDKTGSFSNNLVVVSLPGDEETAKAELAKGKDALQSEKRTLTEVPDRQVGGVSASGFGAAFEQQGVKVLARSWAVPHDGRVYLLTLSSSQQDADHALTQLDEILDTWQWS